MTNLTTWLLARIAEDEAVARACDDQIWSYRPGASAIVDGSITTVVYDEGSPTNEQADHIARHDPARVLAQCEAVRTVVEAAIEAERAANAWTKERLKTDTRSPLPEFARRDAYIETLRALATIWADHPDYREQWT